MVTSGTEHKFLDLSLLCFWDGRPSGPTLDTPLSFEFALFDLSDRRKVIPSADPHPFQVSSRRAYVLWTHDMVELFLSNP